MGQLANARGIYGPAAGLARLNTNLLAPRGLLVAGRLPEPRPAVPGLQAGGSRSQAPRARSSEGGVPGRGQSRGSGALGRCSRGLAVYRKRAAAFRAGKDPQPLPPN
jgi:hypothetical protein